MSIPACRYIGSFSSWYWIPPATCPSTSTTKRTDEPPPRRSSSITATGSGKVLDVTGASAVNGALIHQWDWLGGDNQKWRLEPLLIAFPHPLPTHPMPFG